MSENDRAIGRLEEAVENLKVDVTSIKTNVETLLTWKWKMWGITAVVSIICTGLFELLVAVIERGK